MHETTSARDILSFPWSCGPLKRDVVPTNRQVTDLGRCDLDAAIDHLSRTECLVQILRQVKGRGYVSNIFAACIQFNKQRVLILSLAHRRWSRKKGGSKLPSFASLAFPLFMQSLSLNWRNRGIPGRSRNTSHPNRASCMSEGNTGAICILSPSATTSSRVTANPYENSEKYGVLGTYISTPTTPGLI
jgi:hypothetical protein